MEDTSLLGSIEIEPQPIAPLRPPTYTPPTLRDGESYHVFISYSSIDSQWTHSLIDLLESSGVQVCYHERDFTPGRTVLENMTECIKESQKVLLVLSQEFVKSSWCLLEANMSMFSNCPEGKPIVPVLLEPGVLVPSHLCHITYLEANAHDFKHRLLKMLCTPNQQLQDCTLVPFQQPSIYNGKALQPLTAVNKDGLLKWEFGWFDETRVPDQLRMIIEDQYNYKEAIRIINSVSQDKSYFNCSRGLTYFLVILLIGFVISVFLTVYFFPYIMPLLAFVVIGIMIKLSLRRRDETRYVEKVLKKAIGQANIILSKEKVLMGFFSNSQIHLVYVSLHDCKLHFAESFPEQGEEMFKSALEFFSSDYAACLTHRNFPFPPHGFIGHLEEGVCFCQYATYQISKKRLNR